MNNVTPDLVPVIQWLENGLDPKAAAQELRLYQQKMDAQKAAQVAPFGPDDGEWIVNDLGELGVRVHGRCFFCYKGESLEYETGMHDDGSPILHRNVGKREFGETVWPCKWYEAGRRETRYAMPLTYQHGLSFDKASDPRFLWRVMPTYQPNDGEIGPQISSISKGSA